MLFTRLLDWNDTTSGKDFVPYCQPSRKIAKRYGDHNENGAT